MASFRAWRAPQLLGAWLVYWVLLFLAVFARPLLLIPKIAALPEGRSSASASFGDGAFDAKMSADGQTLWHGHASYPTVVLWIVVPPLLLWLAWVIAARQEPASPPASLGAGSAEEAWRARERMEERR